MSERATVSVRGVLTTLRLVYVVLLSSVLLYLAVAMFAVEPDNPPAGSTGLLVPLAALAALVGVATPFVRRALLPPLATQGPAPAEMPSRTSQRLMIAAIVGWALSESVALFGLVLAFTTRNVAVMPPFVAGSLLLFAAFAPRRSLVEDAARAAAADA